MGPRESASQWWRIITMIRAAFHGAPVLRERDSRNSRDLRQKEVQKAPHRKKTCNQRVKKQNFHDSCYRSLLPCLAFCVHGIWNNVHLLFLFHLSHFGFDFFFSFLFFFFNELYNYYTFCSATTMNGIIFIGIEIKKAKFIRFKVFGFKKYSKRF